MHRILLAITAMALAMGGFNESAIASENELKTTVQALKSRLRDQQQQILDLERKINKAPDSEQIKQMLKENAEAESVKTELPKWLDGIKLSGDLRLRYQRNWADGEKHRNRMRYRLRVGVSKSWLDGQVVTAFRLASGDNNGPTSTNETVTDNFASDDLWIDYAYAEIKPNCVKGLKIVGGKMKNPFVKTDMLWDSDVTPEGGFAGFSAQLGPVKPFVGAAYLIIDENAGDHDASLSGYQAGMDIKLGPITWQSSGCYYYFEDYENYFPAANGNTENAGKLLAGSFHVLDILNTLKLKVADIPVAVSFDYAKNMAEDDPTPGMQGLDTAYAAYAKIGKNKKQGDWSLKYKYAYIEANAVPGGLNDGDFGGSNRKGHAFGAAYNITDFMSVAATCIHAEDIDGADAGVDDWTGQFDVIFKY